MGMEDEVQDWQNDFSGVLQKFGQRTTLQHWSSKPISFNNRPIT